MADLTEALKQHYQNTFAKHGATAEGVDWGAEPGRLTSRYNKMLEVIPESDRSNASVLDVGCGFGGLQTHAQENNLTLDYTGIDIVKDMIEWAQENVTDADFHVLDILQPNDLGKFNYVICNGILTQKLDASRSEMDGFFRALVRKMYLHCSKGLVFNMMTDRVNFHSDNLYYRNPLDVLAWVQAEISPYVRLDHAYAPYEFTIYVYRDIVRN